MTGGNFWGCSAGCQTARIASAIRPLAPAATDNGLPGAGTGRRHQAAAAESVQAAKILSGCNRLHLNPQTGVRTGIAFVTLGSAADAGRALQLDGTLLGERTIHVNPE